MYDGDSDEPRYRSARAKFESWIEEEEDFVQPEALQEKPVEARSITELSSYEITRILFDEFKEGYDQSGQRNDFDRGSFRSREFELSSPLSVNTDWTGLFESLGDISSSQTMDEQPNSSLLEGESGVDVAVDDLFEPIDTFEEEFEECVQSYSRALYSRFVTRTTPIY